MLPQKSSVILALALCAMPLAVRAQTLRVTPSLVDASHAIEDALMTHRGHASTAIEGRGSVLRIEYSSSEAVEVYMVPLAADGTYVPTDFVHFTLPQSDQGTVAIDLTVSPGWSLETQKWLLNLLSQDASAGLGFTDIEFEEASTGRAIIAALRHFFTEETYTPSSYHALRGYRFLGTSFTVALGLLTLATLVTCSFAFGKDKRRTAMLLSLLIGSLVYQARFSVDLLRLSAEHLSEYSHGTYDEAGSIHEVAAFINAQGQAVGSRRFKSPATEKRNIEIPRQPDASVYICRDGTNFKEKLLRYFVYPIRVSSDAADAGHATIAVVMNKFKMGFTSTAGEDGRKGQLRCGGIDRQIVRLKTFADGTIVFSLLPS